MAREPETTGRPLRSPSRHDRHGGPETPETMDRRGWMGVVKWIAVLAIAVWLLNLFVSWIRGLLSST